MTWATRRDVPALGRFVPPASIVRPALRARSALRRAHDRMAPPFAFLVERLPGLIENKLIAVACELGVPDALAAGPLRPDVLADRVGADPDALGRMLRFLVARGFFSVDDGGRYANNDVTEVLRVDHPQSVRDWVLFVGADWHWHIWNHARQAIETGRSATEAATGTDYFDFVNRVQPSAGATFAAAMAAASRLTVELLVSSVDVVRFSSFCDVGGGTGNVLVGVLDAVPAATGTVYDLPELAERAEANLARSGAGERCRFVGGDFFDAVPSGADCYLLLSIVHDWDDDSCTTILSNVRRSMGDGARVLVVEPVLGDEQIWDFPAASDVLMLVLAGGGRERSGEELRSLFRGAGLEVVRDTTLPNLFHAFELRATDGPPDDRARGRARGDVG